MLHWAAQGVSPEQLNLLRTASITFADLPGRLLGIVTGNRIILDNNAAGFGWYVDATPQDCSEFHSSRSPATNRMDLLSVVTHEFGHLLGFGHTEAKGSLMSESLKAGSRPFDLLASASIDRTPASMTDQWAVRGVGHVRRASASR